jgi:RimJ/RimL family protein N-acetyltransferase/predicted acetyltransferase
MTQPVALETPRLVLRELRDEDAPAIHAYASDTEVVRHLDWGPNTPEDTAAFVAMAQAVRDAVPRTAYHLAVTLKTAGHLIGGCRIEIRNAASGAGDLGYVLGRLHWGQGYATEAARAVVGFGFESLALHRIWATCDVRNEASARVLEKLGMKREGHLRHDVRRKGEWRDSYLYGLLAPEWQDDPSRARARSAIAGSRPPAVELEEATTAEIPTLRRLMQLYLYDLATVADWDVGGDGTFGDTEVIERFWGFAMGRHALLIRASGQLAGFVLLREGSYYGEPGTREISEFFVLRRYRGQGVGERAAIAAFDRFVGPWEVREFAGNVPAQRFWRTVIRRYTGGSFTETPRHDERFSGIVQHFNSARPAPRADEARSG